jgi:hypothetical protein
MTGVSAKRSSFRRQLLVCSTILAGSLAFQAPAVALVKISDGFGDGDRNNDGAITSYDTDLNDSGTFNDPTADAGLISRGITEITTPLDANDKGIIWSGIRSFDTAANITKSTVKIINDDVATGTETTDSIFHHGYALGVESRGTGSSMMGRFPQPVSVGPVAGDKIVVSVDFRTWLEASNPNSAIGGNVSFNELRWGVFQDTDHELGMSANVGKNGASVVWGRDDGNWFASQPGAEGDKGIYSDLTFGSGAASVDARIKWENNVLNINGTTNNGRIFEGSGVSDTPGVGGDTGTIASPPGNGTGGTIPSSSENVAPHNLSIQIIRQADGSLEVSNFVDTTEILRDTIKTTDTGYNVLGPPPDSFDYVAFRNASGDFDYVLDNFKVEVFGSNAVGGVQGDYNNDGVVNMADYVLWRNGGPLQNEGASPGVNDAADYAFWKAHFGATSGSGSGLGGGNVPEPASMLLLIAGGFFATGTLRRTSRKA